MVRDKGIVIRVEQETKERLEQAAQALGKTLSTFVIEAAEVAAAKVRKKVPEKAPFKGVPSFFRAACAEAARGGSIGYGGPGFHLSIHLGTNVPDGFDDDEWEAELDRLRAAIRADDGDRVWEWFHAWFPRCVALIPIRRKQQFLEGVSRAYEEEKI